MKTYSLIDPPARRSLAPLAAIAVVAACSLLYAAAQGAAPTKDASPTGKSKSVTVEAIPGGVKRVTLTPRAAERLGIQTGKVSDASLVRKQMVSGLIMSRSANQPLVPPQPGGPAQTQSPKPDGGMFGGFPQSAAPQLNEVKNTFTRTAAQASDSPAPALAPVVASASASVSTLQPDANGVGGTPIASPGQALSPLLEDAWVLITLSKGEWDRLDKDKPARLHALSTREPLRGEVMARPSGIPPAEDAKRNMLSVYYVVPGKEHGLNLHSRMRVELSVAGDSASRKVAPYSAVFYDGKGKAWVYVNTQPLTYERQPISIERIEGDMAVLTSGPPAGTPIVTVGASMLYGSEIFGK